MTFGARQPIGLLHRATILKVNQGKSTVKISLDLSSSDIGAPLAFDVPIFAPWAGREGQFMGGAPKAGDSVAVTQGQGGEWFISHYLPADNAFLNQNTYSSSSDSRNYMAALTEDRWLCQTKNNVRMFGDPKIGIQAGNANNFIQINPVANIISHNFKQELAFTETHRAIKGVVKRDIASNSNRNVTGSILDSQVYDDSLKTIGMDPTANLSYVNSGNFIRNPPFVEDRELVYEFANSYGVRDDQTEATGYDNSKPITVSEFIQRRDSRADTLSLSLVYPNQLIESTKGTVVDFYGNIIDLNRDILPVGKVDDITLYKGTDKSQTYLNIREQLRKSIAFHFEINSRKDVPIPNVNDTSDYARDRSRFYFDIDKEGQFKVNIPASSEVGNVSLLTRYENFTTLFAASNGSDPNSFLRAANKKDIYPENFATVTPVKLVASSNTLDGYASPIDRVTDKPIMLGTAFHDISNTVSSHYTDNPINYYTSSLLNSLPKYSRPIISDTVIVSGEKANAGGRSGTLNMDGSLTVNIGANTVDRQSLWFDYAGSVVGNIGRDMNGVSYAVGMDGDLLIQVGGRNAVANDSRFEKQNNAIKTGALDIRVLKDDGQQTVIRIDSQGVTISTFGRLDIYANQDIRLKSGANLLFDAETIIMYANETGNGRKILRNAQSI
jgi:hypothetical protein